MQKIIILIFSIVFLQSAKTQTILYGLDIDIHGKVVFSEWEQNWTSEVTNPVSVMCDGTDVYIDEWRNAKYEFLTIVEYPDESWTWPSRNDPSNMNDTTDYDSYNNGNEWMSGIVLFDTTMSTYSYYPVDSFPQDAVAETENVQIKKKFQDEIIGLELTEERIAMLKTKLRNYVNHYYGKVEPYEARLDLWSELSVEDSVVEKMAVYDYLVDKLVFYNYSGDQLTSAIGYYYDYGIEFDTLRYDDKGNMIYFSRESIGGTRNEYYIEYNAQSQVSKLTQHYSSVGDTDEDSYINPMIEVNKFEYNSHGKIKAKLFYHEDGSWGRCTFTDKRITLNP